MKAAHVVLAALLCLCLTACGGGKAGSQGDPLGFPAVSQPEKSGFSVAQPGVFSNGRVPLVKAGEVQIPYAASHTESAAWCINSADMVKEMKLPGMDYDSRFFETKALLLVRVTTAGSAVKLDLSHASLQEDKTMEVVVLASPGNTSGGDLCSRILWAEIDKSLLAYRWTVYGGAK